MNQPDTNEPVAKLGVVDTLAPLTAVTVMEDRARVSRRAKLALGAGRHRLRIASVAPVLVDKTLIVAPESESAAASVKVLDARVVRKLVHKGAGREGGDSPQDALIAGLRAELKERERQVRELDFEASRLEVLADQLRRAYELGLADALEDVGYGKEVPASLDTQLRELRERHAGAVDALFDRRADIVEAQEVLSRLGERIAHLETPSDSEWACIDIDIECSAATESQLRIDYAVPGACWRPYHRARLLDEESTRVEFLTDACVWQNTGEDWQGVELTLSTERSSLGIEAPSLYTDSLQTQRKSSAVHIESREQSVDTLAAPSESIARKPELAGIDDGGVALHLRPEGICSLPSDGRPHRIFLSKFVAEAKRELVCMPELQPTVQLATTLENAGATALLAGPVDLLRDSGLVGRTKILYVAAGERFELGWGPEADLRIRREVDESAESSRVLSSWTAKKYTTTIKLSNLGLRAHQVRVVERVPVSEIDKVKIEVDSKASTGAKTSDANGFVEWQMELRPRSHRDIELHYVVKKHDDVVG